MRLLVEEGFDDLIVGAFKADALGNLKDAAGESYELFGRAGGFTGRKYGATLLTLMEFGKVSPLCRLCARLAAAGICNPQPGESRP